LRDVIAGFRKQGLTTEESFLLATHRMGTPRALGAEYSKVNGTLIWRNRVLWMLVGILAFAVGTVVIDATASLASLATAVAGLDGVVGGATSVVVLAAGWATMIACAFWLSRKRSAARAPRVFMYSAMAAAVAILGTGLKIVVPALHVRFATVADFGQSLYWYRLGEIAVSLCALAACVLFIRVLSRLDHGDSITTA
jgi:hypothetical protein